MLEYGMATCEFLVAILLASKFPVSMLFCVPLILENSQYFLIIYSVLLSLLLFSACVCYTFCNCPNVFTYLISIFFGGAGNENQGQVNYRQTFSIAFFLL